MKLNNLYTSLRSQIYEAISGIHDSGIYSSWDNTTPNYLTRQKLKRIYKHALMSAAELGVYEATRFGRCDNRKHSSNVKKKNGDENGYIWCYSLADSEHLSVRPSVHDAHMFYDDVEFIACPCSKNNSAKNNQVQKYYVFQTPPAQKEQMELAYILEDLNMAIENATDNKPRSAIREHLLCAIIKINEEIHRFSLK